LHIFSLSQEIHLGSHQLHKLILVLKYIEIGQPHGLETLAGFIIIFWLFAVKSVKHELHVLVPAVAL
jgi:hypothetical protein